MSKEWMKGDPRRNIFSDTMNVVQMCTLAIKVTLQKALTIKLCPMNIREERKLKISKESCYYCIKCIAATFLTAFMWRRPLNSAALTTTTHRRLKGVFDGMDTQVGTQMINKCRIKMIQKKLYNVRDPPWKGDRKREKKNSIAI